MTDPTPGATLYFDPAEAGPIAVAWLDEALRLPAQREIPTHEFSITAKKSQETMPGPCHNSFTFLNCDTVPCTFSPLVSRSCRLVASRPQGGCVDDHEVRVRPRSDGGRLARP